MNKFLKQDFIQKYFLCCRKCVFEIRRAKTQTPHQKRINIIAIKA